jgi:hypothetical protein
MTNARKGSGPKDSVVTSPSLRSWAVCAPAKGSKDEEGDTETRGTPYRRIVHTLKGRGSRERRPEIEEKCARV